MSVLVLLCILIGQEYPASQHLHPASLMKKTLRVLLYFFLSVLLTWFVAVQSGCFSMRITDQQWVAKLAKAGQPISPQFIDVSGSNDRKIHAIVVAAADTLPLVILVHGSPGGAEGYLKFLADTLLSSVVRMVALDRPGFGYTSGFGIPEPSQAAQAAALKSIADHLAPGRKVYLVGHSLGGPVIARFAMDYPALTAGLVIVAGAIDPTQEEHPWWQAVVDAPPVRWLTPKPVWTSNAEIMPLEKELTQMLPLWGQVTCPVRVIHAINDQLVPIANVDFARRMLVNSSDLTFEILPEGGHFILWTREDIVRGAILDLLK